MESNTKFDKEPKKTGNKKLIGITVAIAAVICVGIVAVISATIGSTEKRPTEGEKAEETLASADDTATEDAADKETPAEKEADAADEETPAEKEADVADEETLAEEETDTGEEASKEELSEETPAEEAAVAGEMTEIANATVGSIVYFGTYEQDNNAGNGTEPVAWYVLDKAGGEATLLSVYLLDCQPYHEEYADITWENCTLRSWLNGEFYNTAFSAGEQAAIVNVNVVNEDNPHHSTEGGNDTEDKLWLLSLGEMEKYFCINENAYDNYLDENMSWTEYNVYCFGQDYRVCAEPTAYAKERGVYAYTEEDAQYDLENGYDKSYAIGSSWWWLRSPGGSSISAAYVSYGGAVNDGGDLVVGSGYGVRPALKVAY